MGNKHTVCTLKREEIAEFVDRTCFTAAEVRALWFHFKEISSTEADDGVIDRTEFQTAMLFRDSVLLDRIFRIFDTNDDDGINFAEFITCLSVMSNKSSPEDKLKLAFQIYDYDRDGFIGREDISTLVAATMREHDIPLTADEVDRVVRATLVDMRPEVEGKINFEEYRAMVAKKPQTLSILTLNISSIIAEYTEAHGISLATPRDPPPNPNPKPYAATTYYKDPNSARSVRKSSRAEGKGL